MNYWKTNTQALQSAFFARTGLDLCDLPDIVCMDDIGIVSDRIQTRAEIAECLEYLMEEHAAVDDSFADAFGF